MRCGFYSSRAAIWLALAIGLAQVCAVQTCASFSYLMLAGIAPFLNISNHIRMSASP